MSGRAGWNEPVEVRPSDTVVLDQQGRLTREIDWVLCQEDHDLIREGRKCINCMEVFKTGDGLSISWPTACPVCDFPVARLQAEEYERSMAMEEVWIGPRPGQTDTDYVNELTERRARREHNPKGSILLPGRDF